MEDWQAFFFDGILIHQTFQAVVSFSSCRYRKPCHCIYFRIFNDLAFPPSLSGRIHTPGEEEGLCLAGATPPGAVMLDL